MKGQTAPCLPQTSLDGYMLTARSVLLRRSHYSARVNNRLEKFPSQLAHHLQSWAHQAVGHHLLKEWSKLFPFAEPLELPGESTTVQALLKAVPRSARASGFYRGRSVRLLREDRLEMAFATIGRTDQTIGDETLRGFQSSEPPRPSVGGIERNRLGHRRVDTLRVQKRGGKEFIESPVSRGLFWWDLSEGAPCARLSNRAFNANIRKPIENCAHLDSLFLPIDPDNPGLFDVGVVEAMAHLRRQWVDNLD